MKNKFVMSVRQASELDYALARNLLTTADVKMLSEGRTLAQIRQVLHGYAKIILNKRVVDLDSDPFTPPGSSVIEHLKGGLFYCKSSDISLYQEKKQKNNSLSKEDLDRVMAKKPILNVNVLDYILTDTHIILESWKGKRVVFLGTVYCDEDGDTCVRYIEWDGRKWFWRFRGIDHGFGSEFFFAMRAV